jgi:hypothetical protein
MGICEQSVFIEWGGGGTGVQNVLTEREEYRVQIVPTETEGRCAQPVLTYSTYRNGRLRRRQDWTNILCTNCNYKNTYKY